MTAPSTATLERVAWTAVALMVLGTLIGIVVPAGIGWDFANFYDAGSKVVAGQVADLYDPAALIAGQPPQGVLQFWSTPISAFLYAPLALLPPLTALIVFKVQNALVYALGLALLFFEYRRIGGGGARERATFAALFATLALVYQPFWTVFRVGGQTMPTVFLLLVLALLAHTRGRHGTTAALLVAAAAIKPAFAPVLFILAVLTGPALIGWSAIWTAGAGLLSIALLGWPIHAEFLQQLRTAGSGLAAPWYYNSSPMVLTANRVLLADAGADAFYGALAWAIRIAVVAMVAHLLLTARRQTWQPQARRHFHFSIAVLACLLLATVAWEHYLTALFLLLSFLVARRAELGPAARRLIAAVFALSVAQNLILVNFVRSRVTFDGHIELLLVGLIKSAPLWLTAFLLVRHRREIFGAYQTAAWEPAAPVVRAAVPDAVTAGMPAPMGGPP